MKISIKKTFHYLLIYFMICLNDSFVYYQIISKYQIIFIAISVFLMVYYKRIRKNWTFIASIVLLLFVIFVRLNSGGIGLNIYFTWILHIFFATAAVLYDCENFLHRYVKLVTFLASISLIYFIISVINLNFARSLTFITLPYGAGYNHTTIDGLFVYCFNPWHYDRNTSIFGEPGLYQIVLNSALFCMLYLREKCNLKHKTMIRYMIILLLAIVTAGSATGFIGTLLIFAGFIFARGRKEERTIKRRLILLFFLAIVFLILEYEYNGNESILSRLFFEKLFSDTGNISVMNGTGKYRWGTIALSFQSIMQNPLGVGYDAVTKLLSTEDGLVAAKILTSAAALGLPWLIFTVYWLFAPILKANWSGIAKIVFILLYINTALAQSQEFYTGFVCIIIVALTSKVEGENENIMVYE